MSDQVREPGDERPEAGSGTRIGNLSRRAFLKVAGGTAALAAAASVARPDRLLGADASPSPGLDTLGPLADAVETWAEPDVFRPFGQDPLTLDVVENVNGFRFSYGGESPGPTIRMSGSETLYLRINNQLGEDAGTSPIGPNPDPVEGYPGPEGAMYQTLSGDDRYGDTLNRIPTELLDDWSLGEHVNGVHSAHVTNLHTHGLHVAPGKNDDGTSSDDIFLRIVPQQDAVKIAQNPELYAAYQENRDEIISSAADFRFALGNVMDGVVGADGQPVGSGVPHPPGTYWYHPHSHGATQNQVASGMAGFLIVEGDVDATLNERIGGNADTSWDERTGDWDYRERSMFLQRTFVAPTADIGGGSPGPDPDELKKKPNTIRTLVNGSVDPDVITMRPGAIERWRVLNGSVDGAGFMRFAVLVGQFDIDGTSGSGDAQLLQILTPDGSETGSVSITDYQPLTVTVDGAVQPVEKARIWQLAWDGITLVVPDGDGWAYRAKDLSTINDGQEPDFASQNDCYAAENIQLCYRRPNELAMSDANRADVLFQAPPLVDGEPTVYTVVSLPTQLNGTPNGDPKVMAHIVVKGEPVSGGGDYPFEQVLDGLAVNPYEIPIGDAEVRIDDASERALSGIEGEAFRSRTIRYGGWGAAGFPLVDVDPGFAAANPDKEKLTFYTPPAPDSTDYALPLTNGDDTTALPITNVRRFPDGDLPTVLLPQNTRTMNIDGEKFFPTSSRTPKMLINTAEEWAVFNESIDLYSVAQPSSSWTPDQVSEYVSNNPELVYYAFDYVDPPPDGALTSPQPYYTRHRYSYPMTLADLKRVNAARSSAGGDAWAGKGKIGLAARATDHPFHIHQNPFWLMRVEVPDENGQLVNILPEPVWSDTVAIPRNGGRVVFRSRFVDFEGEFVEHCHILLHEDNGMMQRLQIVGDPADADYIPRAAIAPPDATTSAVDDIYPPPSQTDSWRQSLVFIDANASGQVFPGEGFDIPEPEPPTE